MPADPNTDHKRLDSKSCSSPVGADKKDRSATIPESPQILCGSALPASLEPSYAVSQISKGLIADPAREDSLVSRPALLTELHRLGDRLFGLLTEQRIGRCQQETPRISTEAFVEALQPLSEKPLISLQDVRALTEALQKVVSPCSHPLTTRQFEQSSLAHLRLKLLEGCFEQLERITELLDQRDALTLGRQRMSSLAAPSYVDSIILSNVRDILSRTAVESCDLSFLKVGLDGDPKKLAGIFDWVLAGEYLGYLLHMQIDPRKLDSCHCGSIEHQLPWPASEGARVELREYIASRNAKIRPEVIAIFERAATKELSRLLAGLYVTDVIDSSEREQCLDFNSPIWRQKGLALIVDSFAADCDSRFSLDNFLLAWGVKGQDNEAARTMAPRTLRDQLLALREELRLGQLEAL